MTFRRCTACGERNIVRDDDFVCALCDGVLPPNWNFEST
ncbi:transcription initiation factor TFIIIB Brf1 subunit/transcription initiation factor TFIIB [Micromonospora sp. A200]|nr:transcription initiation factor TFIIIB Brf1 subunit/transcription initiation factor TFIIB [Micromonospora sp. A200]